MVWDFPLLLKDVACFSLVFACLKSLSLTLSRDWKLNVGKAGRNFCIFLFSRVCIVETVLNMFREVFLGETLKRHGIHDYRLVHVHSTSRRDILSGLRRYDSEEITASRRVRFPICADAAFQGRRAKAGSLFAGSCWAVSSQIYN